MTLKMGAKLPSETRTLRAGAILTDPRTLVGHVYVAARPHGILNVAVQLYGPPFRTYVGSGRTLAECTAYLPLPDGVCGPEGITDLPDGYTIIWTESSYY